MPTYEYECASGHRFEVEQRITDAPLTHHMECDEKSMAPDDLCGAPCRRLLFAPGHVLKGGGWAATGYSKGSK